MKAFLVDDEFLQRKLVKKSVDWQSIGIELCGEAEDGEEALEKIFMLKPDILIMDINIPYVNGIEVSKRVKKVFPETQVIILTAYGEFEYAKEALAFGALSFVLKPLNQKEKILLEQVSGINIYEDSNEIWNHLGISTKKQIVVLIVRFQRGNNDKRAFEIEEMIQDYYPEYEMIIINQRYTFILFGETDMAYKTQMLCTYLQEVMNKNRTWNGGISRVHDNIRDLKSAYHEAYSAAQKGKKDNRLLIYEPVDIVEMLQTLDYDPSVFLYYLRKNEHEMLYKEIETMFDQMEEKNSSLYVVHYVVMDLFIHISFFMSEAGVDFSRVIKKEQQELTGLQNNGSIREIKKTLLDILEKCFGCMKTRKIPVTQRKVQDAIDFIDDNFYKKDMSLNMVAGEIGANASYLSSIFKKEKGCSLSRYLTQVRLEQAKKYLIEYPDKTLIDISEAVGYSDVYYFSKNFKKYYGISPSKYMEERKN